MGIGNSSNKNKNSKNQTPVKQTRISEQDKAVLVNSSVLKN